MIFLDVQPYCQNCPDFEPCSFTTPPDTNIMCEKKQRCAGLYRYLKKEISKSTDDSDIKIYKR